MNVVHVTHEAVEKIGGIGTVIEGLTTARAYDDRVERTILMGPLFNSDSTFGERFGPDGQVIFNTLDDTRPPEWDQRFKYIEKTYDVGIIYGKRTLHEPYSGKAVEVEVLLFEVFHVNQQRLNLFKGKLFEKFAVPSDRFEDIWEYEQYVRIAEPGLEALKAIGACPADEQMLLISHEYMGMPTALKAVLDGQANIKTVFHAHEVASVRPIVEDAPGHDTMFYNVMCEARAAGKTLEDVFPGVAGNFKHPLVKAARYCDHIFAVGDYVKSELEFLDRHFSRKAIDLVYNGIPAGEMELVEKHRSRDLLRDYAEILTGTRPTWIFTHVARPVRSKGLWRDLRVMHAMEELLTERGESAVYFMLGTLGGVRRGRDVRHMEESYGWPVTHETGYPDLCGGEEIIGEMFDAFNVEHTAGRAILVNQWGWSREGCGERMPEEMTLADLRRGSDVEFGLSIYEPFGISQFEPLSYGAICLPSNICGCMGFARQAMAGQSYANILEGNFLDIDVEGQPLETLCNISAGQRDEVETLQGRALAEAIIDRLPRDDQARQKLLDDGCDLAHRMSWERVVEEYFMPSLDRLAKKK